MKPVLIILDDWEGRLQASPSWTNIKDVVEIKFLQKSLENTDNGDIEQAEFLMALRERTALTEQVFKRMPNLRLVLQTGGHADRKSVV